MHRTICHFGDRKVALQLFLDPAYDGEEGDDQSRTIDFYLLESFVPHEASEPRKHFIHRLYYSYQEGVNLLVIGEDDKHTFGLCDLNLIDKETQTKYWEILANNHAKNYPETQ